MSVENTADLAPSSSSLQSKPNELVSLPTAWTETTCWPFGDITNAVCCSPNGERVAYAGNTFIHIRSYSNRHKLPVLISGVSRKAIESICFSPDGSKLAAGTADNYVKLFDSETYGLVYETRVADYVKHVVFTPDGTKIIASVGALRYSILDAVTGSVLSTQEIEAVRGICVAVDGKSLVLAGMGKITTVDNLTRLNLRIDCKDVRRICISPDASRIIAGIRNGDFLVINPTNAQTIKSFSGHTKDVRFLSMNWNYSLFVSGSEDKTIRVWNAETCECIHTLEGHTHYVNSVCFGLNNSVISGSEDKTTKVWNC